jgi:D-alanine-D-alanine ligase
VTIRRPVPSDRESVLDSLTLCGAFQADEIRVAMEMFELGLARDYQLLGVEAGGWLQGWACFGKASLTQSSWYLYWICVHPAAQGAGVGRTLERAVEASVREAGGDRLVLETSGRPDYERSRRFYERAGFTLSGRIPDFYKPADDCLIYWKALAVA